MNTLKLKKYTNARKDGSTRIYDKDPGIISFMEFYIDDQPLFSLLDAFYGTKQGTLLDFYIGVFGLFGDIPYEIIKIKKLMGKAITQADFAGLRAQLAHTLDEDDADDRAAAIKDELAEAGLLIYLPACCCDYGCGWLATDLVIDELQVIWTFSDEGRNITFVFDRYAYLDTLKAYMNKVKKILPQG